MVDITPLPPEERPIPAPAPAPPPYQPPMPSANPYEFITNPGMAQVGPPKKKRIIVVAGMFLVLLMVGLIIASVLSSGGGGPKEEYLKALQLQTQLIHISELGEKQAHGSATKNLAITARLSLTNTQEDLTSLAKKAGVSADAKTLTAGLYGELDKKLEDAELNNRFDEEFTATLQELLDSYRQTLKKIYDQTQNTNDKKTVQKIFNNAQQLISDNEEDEEKKTE